MQSSGQTLAPCVLVWVEVSLSCPVRCRVNKLKFLFSSLFMCISGQSRCIPLTHTHAWNSVFQPVQAIFINTDSVWVCRNIPSVSKVISQLKDFALSLRFRETHLSLKASKHDKHAITYTSYRMMLKDKIKTEDCL